MNTNIVITGEGIVSAIGNDCATVLNSLKENRSGIGTMQYLDSEHKELPVGEVKLSNQQMKEMLGIDAEEVSRTTLMAILSIKQALTSAGITYLDSDKPLPRITLISGTTVGGMDVTEKFFNDMMLKDEHLGYLLNHDCGSSTEYISSFFKLFKECTTISTACSSAANAIMLGADLLKSGEADIVIAGGSESLSKFHLNGFNSLMILDHEQCRPFDATRAGLNLGEGAAFIVLEKEEDAKKRKTDIHAYLSGYGNACDAFHQTASSDDGQGAYLAMKQALEMAGLKASDIQYVNAHGTGTPNNDQSETVALQRIFANDMPLISSTKSFTGHTTSASGSIETVISILALQHDFVPGNLGWKNQMENGIIPSLGESNIPLTNVICNSFGFGGNDSSLVISKYPKLNNRQPLWKEGKVKVISEIHIDSVDQLKEISQFVKPLEARRMGKLMKASLLSSLKALKEAGIETPDAIITGTALGCMENSEELLVHICKNGETMIKPTYFMQSTHNTIGSNIAIRTKCHGFNTTFTHGKDSLMWAKRNAEYLLRSGQAEFVLVGCHDESTELFNSMLKRLGAQPHPMIQSVAMVLTLE